MGHQKKMERGGGERGELIFWAEELAHLQREFEHGQVKPLRDELVRVRMEMESRLSGASDGSGGCGGVHAFHFLGLHFHNINII